jgi:hypothetical protein
MMLTACGGSGPTASSGRADPPGAGDPTTTDRAVPIDATTLGDPGTLPQTRDHPGTTSAPFTTGVQALWQGIVDDDPATAMPFFFPLGAYLQVKAVRDPTHDWQTRLVAAYTRDIHTLHAQLGAGTKDATLIGLTAPDGAATWVNPGQESNKLGYWRVYGSTLRYSIGGRTLSLAIYSLISWRGEWYVVHVTHP